MIIKIKNIQKFKNSKQEEIEKEEFTWLNTKAGPLRAYLSKYIMPLLIKGLIECVEKRPDDPIDHLVSL